MIENNNGKIQYRLEFYYEKISIFQTHPGPQCMHWINADLDYVG